MKKCEKFEKKNNNLKNCICFDLFLLNIIKFCLQYILIQPPLSVVPIKTSACTVCFNTRESISQ